MYGDEYKLAVEDENYSTNSPEKYDDGEEDQWWDEEEEDYDFPEDDDEGLFDPEEK